MTVLELKTALEKYDDHLEVFMSSQVPVGVYPPTNYIFRGIAAIKLQDERKRKLKEKLLL